MGDTVLNFVEKKGKKALALKEVTVECERKVRNVRIYHIMWLPYNDKISLIIKRT